MQLLRHKGIYPLVIYHVIFLFGYFLLRLGELIFTPGTYILVITLSFYLSYMPLDYVDPESNENSLKMLGLVAAFDLIWFVIFIVFTMNIYNRSFEVGSIFSLDILYLIFLFSNLNLAIFLVWKFGNFK